MNTKMIITGHMKEVAARYLVGVLKEAGGWVTFSRFYDGSSHTAKVLRDSLRINEADAKWLVPEVVLNSVVGDLQRLGYVEIVPYPQKQLANTQSDFKISLTPQGRQEWLAGRLPKLEDSSQEIDGHYPVVTKERPRKPRSEPTRMIRASDLELRLTMVTDLRSAEYLTRLHHLNRRLRSLKTEANEIHTRNTEQLNEADRERVDQVQKSLATLEIEFEECCDESSRNDAVRDKLPDLAKVPASITISGILAERLLECADKADWSCVQALQQDLTDQGPSDEPKELLKLEQDDWCGAFLALARKKRATARPKTRP